ncbi:MAG: Dabb family protein [Clostridiales bacterium]|jgi:hypothetical protein|nr:Dabb family protein [Clostridiales bacterium]
MFKHVVMQKFTDKGDAATAARLLNALKGKVPTLRDMEVGVNELTTPRSYDLVLIASFDDEAGYHAYDEHPAHTQVRAFIKPRREKTASVDYTI